MPLSWPTGRALAWRKGSWPVPPATPADRCCPLSLALCAGAYWRALEARGLVRRLTGPFAPVRRPSLHQPLVLYAGAGRYSSRSQPVFVCGAESRGSGGGLSTSGRAEGGPRLVKRVRRYRLARSNLAVHESRSGGPERRGLSGQIVTAIGPRPAHHTHLPLNSPDVGSAAANHSALALPITTRVCVWSSRWAASAATTPLGVRGSPNARGLGGPRRTKLQSDRRQRP